MMELKAKNLYLQFRQANGENITILDIDSLAISRGSKVAFVGSSGAGKTTLLYALAGLQPLDKGMVLWNEVDIYQLQEAERDLWRRNFVGIIFQDFFLYSGLNILQNILLPLSFFKTPNKQKLKQRAKELIEQFQLPHANNSVVYLSRGERQRVAIARALLLSPPLIIADEPTAHLDEQAAQDIRHFLLKQVHLLKSTLLIVTHDEHEKKLADKVIYMKKGKTA